MKNTVLRFAPFVLAVMVGVMMIAPSVWFRTTDAYQGIDFFSSDAEESYLSFVQDPFHPLAVQPAVGPLAYRVIALVTGQSIATANIIAKFLFPALLTLLVYLFFLTLVKRRGLSFVLTAFVMMVPATGFLLNPSGILSFFTQASFAGAEYQALTFARPVNPLFAVATVAGFVTCTWRFCLWKKEWPWGVGAAVAFGLSFYASVFAYAITLGIVGMVAATVVVRKEWEALRRLAMVIVGGAIVAIPAFVRTWQQAQHPEFARVAQVFGAVPSREFILGRIIPLAALAALLRAQPWKRRNTSDPFVGWNVFAFAFLAAVFVGLNQQWIVGWEAPVPAHYHWYFVIPFGGAILIGSLFLMIERFLRPVLFRAMLIVSTMIFLIAGGLYQWRTFQSQEATFVARQRYVPVLQWLDATYADRKTIFADDAVVSYLLPVYTRHHAFAHRDVNGQLVSERQLRHTLFLFFFLQGVTADQAEAFVFAHRDDIGNRLYGQYYRSLNGCYGCFSDDLARDIAADYRSFLETDFVTSLRQYPVDLVVWDREQHPEWALDRFFTKPVYEQGDVVVYAVSD